MAADMGGMRTPPKPRAGFTTIELMVTLAIAAILVTMAVPSLQSVIRNSRLRTHTNELALSLTFARSESVKRGITVTVCKSANATDCGGNTVQWEQGWIVFADSNNDGVVDEGEDVLRVAGAVRTGYSLRGNSNLANSLTFRATGVSNASGTFVLCAQNKKEWARAVIINLVGRVRVAPDEDHDGIPETSAGEIKGCIPPFTA